MKVINEQIIMKINNTQLTTKIEDEYLLDIFLLLEDTVQMLNLEDVTFLIFQLKYTVCNVTMVTIKL